MPHSETRYVHKHILSVMNSYKEDSKLGVVVCTVISAPGRQSSKSCKFTLGYTAPGSVKRDGDSGPPFNAAPPRAPDVIVPHFAWVRGFLSSS